MMLTEEECEKALEHFEKCYWYQDCSYGAMSRVRKDLDILNKLIHEHFSNPPLKFDELKEGMWVWDNKMVLYIRIAKIIGKTIYAEDFLYGFDCYGRYEKNRFYRKEVQE